MLAYGDRISQGLPLLPLNFPSQSEETSAGPAAPAPAPAGIDILTIDRPNLSISSFLLHRNTPRFLFTSLLHVGAWGGGG